ncbi:Nocturnin [Oryzias melastigma]|uniref:Nocturnin n=1 Tax=Oryzias melastigma TaxID=30732 RepID=A0A834FN96_ORYME|nr:Nocturnin [Oryzias melastigma]
MNPARRCSALLGQVCATSLGAPRRAAGARSCHSVVGGNGAGSQPMNGPAGSGSATALSLMGGSGSSRLFGTLAQSLPQPEPYLEENPDLDLDPDQLRKECEEVLQQRPARPHRDLVRSTCMAPCSHKYNPPIRIMQWNILAQALGEGKDGFIRCPLDALNWNERKYLILEEILTHRPDVLCLQEVDHYYDTFQPILARLGYQGSFLPKPWSPCLDVEQNNWPRRLRSVLPPLALHAKSHGSPAAVGHDAAHQSSGHRADALLPGDGPQAVCGRHPPEGTQRLGETTERSGRRPAAEPVQHYFPWPQPGAIQHHPLSRMRRFQRRAL